MANTTNDWYFTKDQLESTPSKQCGVEPYKELSYRQQAANFIQDMGQKLKVSQLCINTAIVYMHRFYVFHSFTRFPWNSIAAAALFLAAKVEEQPRKLEHVIRVVNLCKNPHDTSFDTTSERYLAQSQDLVFNENVLLQTLGFDVAIDHPHTHVVRCCHLVRASKDLAQTSYFMASNREWRELARQLIKLSPEHSESAQNIFLQAYTVATKSLHLTTMCLQYKPTVVACFCIHFVCKWSNWEIPLSNEKKEWFSYVDETVTSELLEQLTKEFLYIYDRCPSRLKEKIIAIGDSLSMSHSSGHPSSPFEPDKKFGPFPTSESHALRLHQGEPKIATLRLPHESSGGSGVQHRDREREYREKKERERGLGHHTMKPPSAHSAAPKHPSTSHTTHSTPPKHNNRATPVSHAPNPRTEQHPRDILREATRSIALREFNGKDGAVSAGAASQKPAPHNQRQEMAIAGAKRLEAVRSAQPRRRDDPKPHGTKLGETSDLIVNNNNNGSNKKHFSTHDPNAIANSNNKSASSAGKNTFAATVTSATPKAVSSEASSNRANSNSNNHNKSELFHHFHPHGGASGFNLHTSEVDTNTISEVMGFGIKKPSLFSPEKSPPNQKRARVGATATAPVAHKPSSAPKRSRTSSTNSEPELRPVMKKIEQVHGFENIIRDASIKTPQPATKVPELILPIADENAGAKRGESSIAKELKPPDLIPPFAAAPQPIVNGMETNPRLISTLLKEATHLPTALSASVVAAAPEHKEQHKKSKKEKHKHRDRDRSKGGEEREKKKKHKDRDRHKHKTDKTDNKNDNTQPIKITISKDKIVEAPLGVKIKIPKDRIKTDCIGESSASNNVGGLKIKISKDVITNFMGGEHSTLASSTTSRKREWDKTSSSAANPTKVSKSNHNRHGDVKTKYGGGSTNKVARLGDGETSIHRLAESKFINRGAAT